ISFGIGDQLFSDLVAEHPEGLVLRHEIRLAVDFDENSGARTRSDTPSDDALSRFAASLLCCSSSASLAQDIDSGVEIAIRFGERLLAGHQSGVGHFAQLSNGGSSYFSHKS